MNTSKQRKSISDFKIAFFSENRFQGKVSEDHANMRTDMAWIHLLNADHYWLSNMPDRVPIEYDIGIIILPKNKVNIDIVKIKRYCQYVSIMQEGPADYWTDYTLLDQSKYLNLLDECDFLLCHNRYDINYYLGLSGKPTFVMPTAMAEKNVSHLRTNQNRSGVIIGGNMCAWYNGMVSYQIASTFDDVIYAPSMGRKVSGEERINNLFHLPYMSWQQWMHRLRDFKFAVHLMPTIAAGTFALNCTYLGIPCIGYNIVDTQVICQKEFAVPRNDLYQARLVAEDLASLSDNEYLDLSRSIMKQYDNYFHSSIFKDRMLDVFNSVLEYTY